MNWKRSIILTSSILVIIAAVKLVQACAGGDDPYDYFPTFFQNNITGNAAYRPFYYTSYLTYYDEPDYMGDALDSDAVPDANIPEWITYCDKDASYADVDSFVYTFPLADVSNLYDHLDKDAALSVSSVVADNSFTKWFEKKKDMEALGYLVFAKQCEPYTRSMDGYYDNKTNNWVTPKRDSAQMQQLVESGLKKQQNAKSDFIKWRYTYQILRMAFYCGNCEQTLKLYDQLIGNRTADNIIYPRCLGLKAGAIFNIGDKHEAAYIYSRVFDISDEMKRSAYISYHWTADSNRAATLKYCKNDHERAMIYIMDGLHQGGATEDGLTLMEQAYKLDPSVKGLDVVMTREINIVEDGYLSKALVMSNDLKNSGNYFGPTNYYVSDDDRKKWKETQKTYLDYLSKLNGFAQKMAADGKNGDKSFWYLSSAYIYFMQNKADDCHKYLAMAKQEHMSAKEQDVYDVVNTLYIIKSNNTITAQTEQDMLPSLQSIEQRSSKNQRFAKVYRDMMFTVLPSIYLQQKDTLKALYSLSRAMKTENGFSVDEDYTDIPGSLLENMAVERLHTVQAFVSKTDKTPFEKWLTTNTPYSNDALHELEGTKYIRMQQFDKAVNVLQNISKEQLGKIELPDMQVSHLQDSQDWNTSDSTNEYNKLQFARKMLELQQGLTANPKDGRLAYQYANGLYSMTYYGKGHHAFDYYRSTSDDDGYYDVADRKKLPAYKQDYYTAATAMKYYVQAYENSADAEVKARCLFLAAKCWQKSCPVPPGKTSYYEMDEKDYYLNALKNPYFKQLKDGYKNTKFYNSAYNTCSYLKDYIRKGK